MDPLLLKSTGNKHHKSSGLGESWFKQPEAESTHCFGDQREERKSCVQQWHQSRRGHSRAFSCSLQFKHAAQTLWAGSSRLGRAMCSGDAVARSAERLQGGLGSTEPRPEPRTLLVSAAVFITRTSPCSACLIKV